MSRTIKILHVVYFLEPGGMENGIVNIANRLGDEFDIHCCCLDRAGVFVERLKKAENVHVLGGRKGFSVRTGWDLAGLIRRLQPDMLHSHNLGPLIYSAMGAAFAAGCRIIQGEHSLLTPEECSPRRLRQRKWLYRVCREVHSVSTQLRDQLVQLGFPQDKMTVIANGVDTNRFQPSDATEARRRVGLGHVRAGTIVLGVVGRFGAFKRHDVLLQAFELVANEHPNVDLLVVGGGGPKEQTIRAQVANSRFSSRIHLSGFQQDVTPYYQAMDMLVIPSENEGMSNAMLEAMACGLPVLAHNICGNSEVITSNMDGRVADLGTVDKLAEELKKLLAMPAELVKMKQMARRKVQTDYSLDAMMTRYADLYRRNALNR